MQHPAVAQSHAPAWSTKTGWQSVRASHVSWSVISAQGIDVGHGGGGLHMNASPGSPQPAKVRPWQPLQYSAWQSPRALHTASLSPAHGARMTGQD